MASRRDAWDQAVKVLEMDQESFCSWTPGPDYPWPRTCGKFNESQKGGALVTVTASLISRWASDDGNLPADRIDKKQAKHTLLSIERRMVSIAIWKSIGPLDREKVLIQEGSEGHLWLTTWRECFLKGDQELPKAAGLSGVDGARIDAALSALRTRWAALITALRSAHGHLDQLGQLSSPAGESQLSVRRALIRAALRPLRDGDHLKLLAREFPPPEGQDLEAHLETLEPSEHMKMGLMYFLERFVKEDDVGFVRAADVTYQLLRALWTRASEDPGRVVRSATLLSGETRLAHLDDRLLEVVPKDGGYVPWLGIPLHAPKGMSDGGASLYDGLERLGLDKRNINASIRTRQKLFERGKVRFAQSGDPKDLMPAPPFLFSSLEVDAYDFSAPFARILLVPEREGKDEIDEMLKELLERISKAGGELSNLAQSASMEEWVTREGDARRPVNDPRKTASTPTFSPGASGPKDVGSAGVGSHPKAKVYLSYKRDEHPETVRQLSEWLKQQGFFDFHIDEDSIDYKDSIGEFVDRLGDGDAVVVVLGKQYFRSAWCMRELLSVSQKQCWSEQIFPLALPDCNVGDTVERLAIQEHWVERRREIAGYEHRGIFCVGERDRAERDRIEAFVRHLPEVLGAIGDMTMLEASRLDNASFETLRDRLAERLRKLGHQVP